MARYLKLFVSMLALLFLLCGKAAANTGPLLIHGKLLDLSRIDHARFLPTLDRYPPLTTCRKAGYEPTGYTTVHYPPPFENRDDFAACLLWYFSLFEDPETEIVAFLRSLNLNARTTDWCKVEGDLSKLGKTITTTWENEDFPLAWRETPSAEAKWPWMRAGLFLYVEIDCNGRVTGVTVDSIQ
ncbi:MAG: hypothetical protein AAGE89_05045 [Pseudomonadota bacterium]